MGGCGGVNNYQMKFGMVIINDLWYCMESYFKWFHSQIHAICSQYNTDRLIDRELGWKACHAMLKNSNVDRVCGSSSSA